MENENSIDVLRIEIDALKDKIRLLEEGRITLRNRIKNIEIKHGNLIKLLSENPCKHEWEMRIPADLNGNYMAFCKKCGYLRDSIPKIKNASMNYQYYNPFTHVVIAKKDLKNDINELRDVLQETNNIIKGLLYDLHPQSLKENLYLHYRDRVNENIKILNKDDMKPAKANLSECKETVNAIFFYINNTQEILQKFIKIMIPYVDGKLAPVMYGWVTNLDNNKVL